MIEKRSAEVIDHEVDWSDDLGSDTISTSTFTVPAGLTKDSESNTTTTATVWLSGGADGDRYLITNEVVTAGGRTLRKSFEVLVADPAGYPTYGTALWVRRRFVEESGRFDLVVDAEDENFGDNGADVFVNRAQRWLDRQVYPNGAKGRRVVNLSVGEYEILADYIVSLELVYVVDADGDRHELSRARYRDIIMSYDSDVTQGTPAYWAFNVPRLAPEQRAETDLSGYEGVDDMVTGDEYEKRQVIIYPPPDEAFTIQMYGRFWSPRITSGSDKTWWTVNAPELLILAAQYMHEVSLGNRSGARDWLEAVNVQLVELIKDEIDNEMPDTPIRVEGVGNVSFGER